MVHLRSNYFCVSLLGPSYLWPRQKAITARRERDGNRRTASGCSKRRSQVVGPFEILTTGLLHCFISGQSSFIPNDNDNPFSISPPGQWTDPERSSKNSFSNKFGKCFSCCSAQVLLMNEFCGEIKDNLQWK